MLGTGKAAHRFADRFTAVSVEQAAKLPSELDWEAWNRAIRRVTRRIVLEVADARETKATRADVEAAEEAFVASSVREVITVSRVEDGELARGPVTDQTAHAVRERIEAELAAAGQG